MPEGYASAGDAILAAAKGPADGSYAGEEWIPLQCAGCGQWFPVLKSAVDAIESLEGYNLKMQCQDCRDG